MFVIFVVDIVYHNKTFNCNKPSIGPMESTFQNIKVMKTASMADKIITENQQTNSSAIC